MKHMVIPDTQIKPGVPTDHIIWAAKYAIDKKPDVIVQIGDWADMSSLSSYDVGKKDFEGRQYTTDIECANQSLADFMRPIRKEQERLRRNRDKQWNPTFIYTRGNHEQRIAKAINNDRKLEGLISFDDLDFERHGWEVYPFLEPAVVDGIAYCHYFVSGVLGRPVTTARALLAKHHMSCIAGHQQGRDIAYGNKANGNRITGIIAGSFYQHDEAYLNHQTNNHWRGIYMLHEVEDGSFDEMPVSIKFLKEKYA